MEIKKIVTISIIGILFLTSVISFSKYRDTQKELTEITTLNNKLDEQNKKLLDANDQADKKIDDLAKKYDKINKELAEIKANSQQTY